MNEAPSISHLNNHGAELFYAGDYKDATRQFAAALDLSRRSIPFAATERPPKVGGVDSLMDKPVADQDFESWAVDRCYVYGHPIRIPGMRLPTTTADYIAMSAILIFNLALSHHFSAMSLQTNNDTTYKKAVRFYEIALELQAQELFEEDYFTVAILNNLGSVFHELGQEKESARYFHRLLAFLTGSSIVTYLRDERIYEIFYPNVILNFLVDTAAMSVAPAA